jgi:drug/metabolite transporter (DMT)-like permease
MRAGSPWIHIALVGCVVLLAGGQIVLKKAAVAYSQVNAIFANPVMLALSAGLLLYATSSILWVWLLQYVPLNRAYPYVAIAFVLVPIASWWVFGETIDARYCVGVLLIVAGIILTLAR